MNIGFSSILLLILLDYVIYTTQEDIQDLGCWKDSNRVRSLPSLERTHHFLDGQYKTRSQAVEKCAQVAIDHGYTVFGIQNGGQCFAGARGEKRYMMYGPSNLCKDGKGGPWSNNVYSTKTSFGRSFHHSTDPSPWDPYCSRDLDILILLDGSGTINKRSKERWDEEKDFVIKFMKGFDDRARIGLIQYGSDPEIILDMFQPKKLLDDIKERLDKYKMPGGVRTLNDALKRAWREQMKLSNRTAADKVVIAMTTGDVPYGLYGSSQFLTDHDVRVIALGLDKNVHYEFLQSVASYRDVSNIFSVNSGQLLDVAPYIYRDVCNTMPEYVLATTPVPSKAEPITPSNANKTEDVNSTTSGNATKIRADIPRAMLPIYVPRSAFPMHFRGHLVSRIPENSSIDIAHKKNLVTAVRKGAPKEDVASMVLVNPSPELNLDLTEQEAEEINNRNKKDKSIFNNDTFENNFPQPAGPTSNRTSFTDFGTESPEEQRKYLDSLSSSKGETLTKNLNPTTSQMISNTESPDLGTRPADFDQSDAMYSKRKPTVSLLNERTTVRQKFRNTMAYKDKSNNESTTQRGDNTDDNNMKNKETTTTDVQPNDNQQNINDKLTQADEEDTVFNDSSSKNSKSSEKVEINKNSNNKNRFKPTSNHSYNVSKGERLKNAPEKENIDKNEELEEASHKESHGDSHGDSHSYSHGNLDNNNNELSSQNNEKNEKQNDNGESKIADDQSSAEDQSINNVDSSPVSKTYEGKNLKGSDSKINGVGAVSQTLELHSGNGKQHVTPHHIEHHSLFPEKLSDRFKMHHLNPMFGGRAEITSSPTAAAQNNKDDEIYDGTVPKLSFRNLTGLKNNNTSFIDNAGKELAEIYEKVHTLEAINDSLNSKLRENIKNNTLSLALSFAAENKKKNNVTNSNTEENAHSEITPQMHSNLSSNSLESKSNKNANLTLKNQKSPGIVNNIDQNSNKNKTRFINTKKTAKSVFDMDKDDKNFEMEHRESVSNLVKPTSSHTTTVFQVGEEAETMYPGNTDRPLYDDLGHSNSKHTTPYVSSTRQISSTFNPSKIKGPTPTNRLLKTKDETTAMKNNSNVIGQIDIKRKGGDFFLFGKGDPLAADDVIGDHPTTSKISTARSSTRTFPTLDNTPPITMSTNTKATSRLTAQQMKDKLVPSIKLSIKGLRNSSSLGIQQSMHRNRTSLKPSDLSNDKTTSQRKFKSKKEMNNFAPIDSSLSTKMSPNNNTLNLINDKKKSNKEDSKKNNKPAGSKQVTTATEADAATTATEAEADAATTGTDNAGTTAAGTNNTGTTETGTDNAATTEAGTGNAGTKSVGRTEAGATDSGTSIDSTTGAIATDIGINDGGTKTSGSTTQTDTVHTDSFLSPATDANKSATDANKSATDADKAATDANKAATDADKLKVEVKDHNKEGRNRYNKELKTDNNNNTAKEDKNGKTQQHVKFAANIHSVKQVKNKTDREESVSNQQIKPVHATNNTSMYASDQSKIQNNKVNATTMENKNIKLDKPDNTINNRNRKQFSKLEKDETDNHNDNKVLNTQTNKTHKSESLFHNMAPQKENPSTILTVNKTNVSPTSRNKFSSESNHQMYDNTHAPNSVLEGMDQKVSLNEKNTNEPYTYSVNNVTTMIDLPEPRIRKLSYNKENGLAGNNGGKNLENKNLTSIVVSDRKHIQKQPSKNERHVATDVNDENDGSSTKKTNTLPLDSDSDRSTSTDVSSLVKAVADVSKNTEDLISASSDVSDINPLQKGTRTDRIEDLIGGDYNEGFTSDVNDFDYSDFGEKLNKKTLEDRKREIDRLLKILDKEDEEKLYYEKNHLYSKNDQPSAESAQTRQLKIDGNVSTQPFKENISTKDTSQINTNGAFAARNINSKDSHHIDLNGDSIEEEGTESDASQDDNQSSLLRFKPTKIEPDPPAIDHNHAFREYYKQKSQRQLKLNNMLQSFEHHLFDIETKNNQSARLDYNQKKQYISSSRNTRNLYTKYKSIIREKSKNNQPIPEKDKRYKKILNLISKLVDAINPAETNPKINIKKQKLANQRNVNALKIAKHLQNKQTVKIIQSKNKQINNNKFISHVKPIIKTNVASLLPKPSQVTFKTRTGALAAPLAPPPKPHRPPKVVDILNKPIMAAAISKLQNSIPASKQTPLKPKKVNYGGLVNIHPEPNLGYPQQQQQQGIGLPTYMQRVKDTSLLKVLQTPPHLGPFIGKEATDYMRNNQTPLNTKNWLNVNTGSEDVEEDPNLDYSESVTPLKKYDTTNDGVTTGDIVESFSKQNGRLEDQLLMKLDPMEPKIDGNHDSYHAKIPNYFDTNHQVLYPASNDNRIYPGDHNIINADHHLTPTNQYPSFNGEPIGTPHILPPTQVDKPQIHIHHFDHTLHEKFGPHVNLHEVKPGHGIGIPFVVPTQTPTNTFVRPGKFKYLNLNTLVRRNKNSNNTNTHKRSKPPRVPDTPIIAPAGITPMAHAGHLKPMMNSHPRPLLTPHHPDGFKSLFEHVKKQNISTNIKKPHRYQNKNSSKKLKVEHPILHMLKTKLYKNSSKQLNTKRTNKNSNSHVKHLVQTRAAKKSLLLNKTEAETGNVKSEESEDFTGDEEFPENSLTSNSMQFKKESFFEPDSNEMITADMNNRILNEKEEDSSYVAETYLPPKIGSPLYKKSRNERKETTNGSSTLLQVSELVSSELTPLYGADNNSNINLDTGNFDNTQIGKPLYQKHRSHHRRQHRRHKGCHHKRHHGEHSLFSIPLDPLDVHTKSGSVKQIPLQLNGVELEDNDNSKEEKKTLLQNSVKVNRPITEFDLPTETTSGKRKHITISVVATTDNDPTQEDILTPSDREQAGNKREQSSQYVRKLKQSSVEKLEAKKNVKSFTLNYKNSDYDIMNLDLSKQRNSKKSKKPDDIMSENIISEDDTNDPESDFDNLKTGSSISEKNSSIGSAKYTPEDLKHVEPNKKQLVPFHEADFPTTMPISNFKLSDLPTLPEGKSYVLSTPTLGVVSINVRKEIPASLGEDDKIGRQNFFRTVEDISVSDLVKDHSNTTKDVDISDLLDKTADKEIENTQPKQIKNKKVPSVMKFVSVKKKNHVKLHNIPMDLEDPWSNDENSLHINKFEENQTLNDFDTDASPLNLNRDTEAIQIKTEGLTKNKTAKMIDKVKNNKILDQTNKVKSDLDLSISVMKNNATLKNITINDAEREGLIDMVHKAIKESVTESKSFLKKKVEEESDLEKSHTTKESENAEKDLNNLFQKIHSENSHMLLATKGVPLSRDNVTKVNSTADLKIANNFLNNNNKTTKFNNTNDTGNNTKNNLEFTKVANTSKGDIDTSMLQLPSKQDYVQPLAAPVFSHMLPNNFNVETFTSKKENKINLNHDPVNTTTDNKAYLKHDFINTTNSKNNSESVQNSATIAKNTTSQSESADIDSQQNVTTANNINQTIITQNDTVTSINDNATLCGENTKRSCLKSTNTSTITIGLNNTETNDTTFDNAALASALSSLSNNVVPNGTANGTNTITEKINNDAIQSASNISSDKMSPLEYMLGCSKPLRVLYAIDVSDGLGAGPLRTKRWHRLKKFIKNINNDVLHRVQQHYMVYNVEPRFLKTLSGCDKDTEYFMTADECLCGIKSQDNVAGCSVNAPTQNEAMEDWGTMGPRTGHALETARKTFFEKDLNKFKNVIFLISHKQSADELENAENSLKKEGISLVDIELGERHDLRRRSHIPRQLKHHIHHVRYRMKRNSDDEGIPDEHKMKVSLKRLQTTLRNIVGKVCKANTENETKKSSIVG